MDGESGWHSAHKPGDLIRLTKKATINVFDKDAEIGDLGIIVRTPLEPNNTLFFEIYLFKGGKTRLVGAHEIDIISNIDD